MPNIQVVINRDGDVKVSLISAAFPLAVCNMEAPSHSHDGGQSHSHSSDAVGHGHSHEILEGPGSYMGREMPIIEGRDWSERAFTVGIGGYVSVLVIILSTSQLPTDHCRANLFTLDQSAQARPL